MADLDLSDLDGQENQDVEDHGNLDDFLEDGVDDQSFQMYQGLLPGVPGGMMMPRCPSTILWAIITTRCLIHYTTGMSLMDRLRL